MICRGDKESRKTGSQYEDDVEPGADSHDDDEAAFMTRTLSPGGCRTNVLLTSEYPSAAL